jgi:glycosyltransferase involved in cell wall biosynthesis
LPKLGVNLISYESQSKFDRIPRLIKDLRKLRPSIVHAWNFHTNPYANYCGKIAGIPVRIGSVREHPSYWADSNLLKFSAVYGLTGLIFNSNTAYSFYKEKMQWPMKFLLPKGFVINNGIEEQQDENKDKLVKELLEVGISMPVDRQIVKIVGIGRLDANKNWSLLVKSCEYLSVRGVNFITVIFGNGPERTNLLAQIRHSHLQDSFILAGSYSDAARFLPLFDLLCSCSNSEGMPNTIMEASLAGLPVLATNAGGTNEVVDNYQTGILVEQNNLKEFQEKLLYLVSNEKEGIKMGLSGQKKIRNEFSSKSMEKKMVDVYFDLLSKTDRVKG